MNITNKNMWVEPEALNEDFLYPNYWSISQLLEMRQDTYQGFATIEEEKGLLKPLMSIASTHGQEAVRILTQRGFEEILEAMDSVERSHFLEEMIDSLNYFWSILILDPSAPLQEIKEEMLDEVIPFLNNSGSRYDHRWQVHPIDVGNIMVAFSPLFERLRNRSWMNNAQSSGYFDGWPELTKGIIYHFTFVLSCFESWVEFVQFYVAKDNVLQFRLDTKY